MRVLSAKALIVAALLALLVAAPALGRSGAPAGVPRGSSLLFALNGRDGTLAPVAKAKRDDRFTLTLRGLGRTATWFADRPERDAGLLATRQLFSGWGRLGFRNDPPNGALVVRGKDGKHTMAVELKLRRYDAGKRTARFDVRALGSLGGGLDHLNQALEPRLPRHFLSPSLFIDNGQFEPRCTLGETQLMALGPEAKVEDMTPADGRLLKIAEYTALFSIYGTRFGGDGTTTFALPGLAAPAGSTWFLCSEGFYPSLESLTSECRVGEIDYWITSSPVTDPKWSPADGRTLLSSAYPEYAAAYAGSASSFALPTVPAPQGMSALVCVKSPSQPEPLLGALDLYPGAPAKQQASWEPAAGQAVSQAKNERLWVLLQVDPAAGGKVPNMPPVASTAGYFIATDGSWPLG